MSVDTLFLDDDPKRHVAFRSMNPSADMVWTADEAIKAIQEKHYRYIHLDHDLGGRHYVQSDDPQGTGYTVAEAIVKKYVGSRLIYPKVTIHSLNQLGSIEMLKLLYANYFPVCWEPFPMEVAR